MIIQKMMERKTADHTAERSEKIRRLLQDRSYRLLAAGYIITGVILAAIVACVCLMPYPYSNGESILSHLIDK